MAAICDMMYTVPYSKRARFTRGTYAMPRYLQILRDCGPIAASRSFDYELWADRGPIPESIARYMLHCNCDEQKEPHHRLRTSTVLRQTQSVKALHAKLNHCGRDQTGER